MVDAFNDAEGGKYALSSERRPQINLVQHRVVGFVRRGKTQANVLAHVLWENKEAQAALVECHPVIAAPVLHEPI